MLNLLDEASHDFLCLDHLDLVCSCWALELIDVDDSSKAFTSMHSRNKLVDLLKSLKLMGQKLAERKLTE